MRVMVMVKATKSSEEGVMPTEKLMADMGKFNEELVKAGIMKAGEGLKPSSEAVRVHFSGQNRTVSDGPFPETKELVAGFWLWEVDSMEQAIEWVKKCPNPMIEDSDIDIRPIYELEDFKEWDPSGQMTSHEEGLRGAIAAQSAVVQPYLFFGGDCEQAVEFYTQVLGAKPGMMMRFSDSPDPMPEGTMQPGFEKKIMHCDFTIGNLNIMASDGCSEDEKAAGFRLSLLIQNKDDASRVFDALAEGGKIDMPLTQTFWSPWFGMVTDKFGIGWMINVPGEMQGC